ncbi:hypothetical protein [Methylocystis parvus]|uniref:hypothetical protein n=1 Tax=Methylocystis parvus TaxID=134 RepID=UPI003C770621
MSKLRWMAVLALCAQAIATPAFAQAGPALKTCSQAYDQCFNTCAAQFPKGGEKSAKCIDKCAMARAQCDRNGCFKDEGINVCGLSEQ